MMKGKEIGTEQKLWIFGDSFTGMYFESESWQWLLYNQFVGKKMYISSKGSRDAQTIIDIFLRNLKDIKENDFVLIFLPTMARYRLPLNTPVMDMEYHTEYTGNYEFQKESKNFVDYFIGNGYVESIPKESDVIKKLLEEPINGLNPEYYFKPNPPNESPNTANVIEMLNSSMASIKNMNDILNSFINYFPFKIVICSWTNELNANIVNTKSVIKDAINDWETLNDLFKKTDGLEGANGDIHWSKGMNKKFADYIIVNNPEYFGYESKSI